MAANVHFTDHSDWNRTALGVEAPNHLIARRDGATGGIAYLVHERWLQDSPTVGDGRGWGVRPVTVCEGRGPGVELPIFIAWFT